MNDDLTSGLPRETQVLLEAVVAISSDLDLHAVLKRIVEAACRITDATYGALGVLAPTGRELSDFITVGVEPDVAASIGELPRGRGLLGVLIDDPHALRLARIDAHPDSFGFPENHPPMTTFLGAPVRIRGRIFGNLYLTEKRGGSEFTQTDEGLLQVFASAAGFVIENARAYEQSERRRLWLEVSAQISEALQSPDGVDSALREVATGARRLVGARSVALLQRSDDTYVTAVVDGKDAADVPGLLSEHAADIDRAVDARELLVIPGDAAGAIVVVPMHPQLAGGGVLVVALQDRMALESEEVELLQSLADHAALTLDRAEAVTDRQQLMLVADRDRIARDLHDVVIQRLFATGLQLQGTRRIATSPEVVDRIDAAVAELDTTIREIRSTIFDLQYDGHASLRAQVRSLVKEYDSVLDFTPVVRTDGPLDTAVPAELSEQVCAVLREALSNIARHSGATSATVELAIVSTDLRLRVVDDGVGLPEERVDSGLRNVRRRAVEFGGTFRVGGQPAGQLGAEHDSGTVLEWTVPLPPLPDARATSAQDG